MRSASATDSCRPFSGRMSQPCSDHRTRTRSAAPAWGAVPSTPNTGCPLSAYRYGIGIMAGRAKPGSGVERRKGIYTDRHDGAPGTVNFCIGR